MDIGVVILVISAMIFGTAIIAIIFENKKHKIKGSSNLNEKLNKLEKEIRLLKDNKFIKRLESIEEIVLMEKKLDSSSYKHHSALDYKASNGKQIESSTNSNDKSIKNKKKKKKLSEKFPEWDKDN